MSEILLNNIEKLGFDSWFKDKVDLTKTADLKIVRVIERSPMSPVSVILSMNLMSCHVSVSIKTALIQSRGGAVLKEIKNKKRT